jgi:hypothetical protein
MDFRTKNHPPVKSRVQRRHNRTAPIFSLRTPTTNQMGARMAGTAITAPTRIRIARLWVELLALDADEPPRPGFSPYTSRLLSASPGPCREGVLDVAEPLWD